MNKSVIDFIEKNKEKRKTEDFKTDLDATYNVF